MALEISRRAPPVPESGPFGMPGESGTIIVGGGHSSALGAGFRKRRASDDEPDSWNGANRE